MQRVIKLCLYILSALLLCCLVMPRLQSAKAGQDADPAIIASSKDAIVQTESGKVRGYIHTGTFTYKGIPYAQAERFMPPQKPKPWEGVRSSMSFGFVAPQGFGGPVDATAARSSDIPDEDAFFVQGIPQTEREDCQRLNIWSPGINGKRPVMVWLHGGGFSTGSGHGWAAFDGESLSKKGNVVVVTLNHRLNVLGFLDLSTFGPKYKYSGNVGMMDIVAALNWIQTNIANFGGDPGNVTIFGQSGGGGKVSTLMAIPSAKGLFHKAIIESGSTLRVGDSETTRKAGAAIMGQLGLKPDQVDELQKIPYADLAKAGQKAWAKVREEMGGGGQGFAAMLRFGWSPSVDGDFLPAQPFDPAAPEQSKDIPVLVGSTLNEMLASERNVALRNATQAQAEEHLTKTLGPKTAAYIEEFGKVHPGYKPVDLVDTDFFLRPRAIQQAKLKAAQNGAPVYMYLFAWQSPVLDGIHKAFHCAEIPFVFNNIALTEHTTTGSKEAYALADKVSQAWINFAKTGNPNHKGLPHWPAFTDAKRSTMIFDNQSVVKENHDRKLLEITEGN
jgi:para-nitrobenzyl esterase